MFRTGHKAVGVCIYPGLEESLLPILWLSLSVLAKSLLSEAPLAGRGRGNLCPPPKKTLGYLGIFGDPAQAARDVVCNK